MTTNGPTAPTAPAGMAAAASAHVPYAHPAMSPADRELLLTSVRQVATDPEQKFILGRRCAALERALRDRTGAGDVIACGSGTGALSLALRAARIGPGDEVIVPAFGAEPLAACVLGVGATPVFADVHPDSGLLDPADAERRVTARSRAIVPAHVFSSMADMPAVCELAARHRLEVVEDAAVAQGATLRGRPAGTWGDLGLYSFYPVKPFGMAGEGAIVLSDDTELARATRMLRNHGQDGVNRFLHHEIGLNSRFDEIHAAFQLARLPALDELLARRRAVADYYSERFAPLRDRGLAAPEPGADGRCLYVYAVYTPHRDALARHLAAHGVGSRVYHPSPLPRLAAFAPARTGDGPAAAPWPGADRAAARHLALPLHPHLSPAQTRQVADAVCGFFGLDGPDGPDGPDS
ncbi:DegT/DnrJ/EryC1/StrS family aminotransferase [Streptomyces tubbatahanensis]|uniref:DegT/DnrJ/EryC1/StrS family aminotransferase n=1 Tax=Streptomyces tubbatahanensis TaxID=2923272 RepID=A0ABY3XMS8_9ACTN|nr:DegT/DnrJ/EryC1/StrS family aminotransferase [Streptomyces tubbatahanensis]UNS95741.1 DegT/DnrJ/EryC1/StrS family aminotransferase [Streptomyces tubbatahanensis]